MIKTTYTWKNEYILPYESYFSIRSKFCYLNGKSWYWFDTYGRRVVNIEKNNYLDSNLSNIKIKQFNIKDDKIKICPICMRYGYHSYFHNSSLVYNCFIHSSKKLIELSKDDIQQSNTGIYAFSDVTVENIVNAYNILNPLISRFTKHQNKIDLLHIICRTYNQTKPHDSSTIIIQEYYFGNKKINNNSNYKILKKISSKEIFTKNEEIYNRIISSISKDVLQREILLYNDDVDKNIRDRIQLYDEKYSFKVDGNLSIYFLQAFISDKIWSIFKTRDEYNRIYMMLKDSRLNTNNITNNEILKISVYLAIVSLINYRQCDGYYKFNGKVRDLGEICEGATLLIKQLMKLNDWHVFTDSYLENSFLFICEIIINDWFNYIVNDLVQRIHKKDIDYTNTKLLHMPISEYNEPEYFIIKSNREYIILGSYPYL